MEKKSQVLENFEAMLQKKCINKPLALYKCSKTIKNTEVRTQDVIDSVMTQIKALQNADCVKCGRLSNMTYKKGHLMTLNDLPTCEKESKQQTDNKFETQGVSDTQLIEIVKTAEILGADKGMTQELEEIVNNTNNKLTAFTNTPDLLNDNVILKPNISPKKSENDHSEFKNIEVNCISPNTYVQNNTEHIKIQLGESNFKNKQFRRNSNYDNNTGCIEIAVDINDMPRDFDYVDSYNKDKENKTYNSLSLSPVFNLRSKKEPELISSMVFDLDVFEAFENKAFSQIMKQIDLDSNKLIINSQILCSELHLMSRNESESPKPNMEREQCGLVKLTLPFNIPSEVEQAKANTIGQDEILFSSDEDENYIRKETKDLPFTCALETSFYNQLDVLDKTLYVGFQTASNKSIQVCSESFSKAKSVFDNLGYKFGKIESTITELVEKHDDILKNVKSENIFNSSEMEVDGDRKSKQNVHKSYGDAPIDNNYGTEKATTSKMFTQGVIFQSEENNTSHTPLSDKANCSRHSLKGFVTASNKNINLSDLAIARCKKIFQGIDLEDEFDNIDDANFEDAAFKNHCSDSQLPKVNVKETASTDDVQKTQLLTDIDDEHILQEFLNSEMIRDTLLDDVGKSDKILNNEDIITLYKIKENGMRFENPQFQTTCTTPNAPTLTCNSHVSEIDNKLQIETPTALMKKSSGPVSSDVKFNLIELDCSGDICINKGALKELYNSATNCIPLNFLKNTGEPIDTTNNKEFTFLSKGLDSGKKLFQDINVWSDNGSPLNSNSEKSEQDIFKQPALKAYTLKENETIPNFVAFKTASNKSVAISKEALEKSAKLFKDFDNNNMYDTLQQDDDTVKIEMPFVNSFITESCKFEGFKTANNKKIEISFEALHKSKQILQDTTADLTDYIPKNSKSEMEKLDFFKKPTLLPNRLPKNEIILNTVAFNAASNKPVAISKRAIEESAKFLVDLDRSDVHNRSKNEKLDDYIIGIKTPCFSGFQTASNKKVEISAQSLAKTKRIFQDLNYDDSRKSNEDGCLILENRKPLFLTGSEMARNNINIVSAEDQAELIDVDELNGINNDINSNEQTHGKAIESDFKDTNFKSTFKGFQTASKKEVKISEAALAKCRQIFQDQDLSSQFEKDIGSPDESSNTIDTIIEVETKRNMTIKTSYMKNTPGFKTASNHKISISDDAFIKSKNLFTQLDKTPADVSTKVGNLEMNKLQDKEISENILNTQIMDNFYETMYTEDFHQDTVLTMKRPKSPILLCSKAKKKKFETPYKSGIVPIEVLKVDEFTINKNKSIFTEDYKRNKLYKLKDLKQLEPKYSYRHTEMYKTTFDKLLDFIFAGKRNEITTNELHVEDLKEIFIGEVNHKLIPDGWLDNHLKLILWKLLSYERIYPKTLGNVCTASNVLNQLKYRYDKELYNAERPALRKILEKDDVPSKTLVLCVVDIIKPELDEKCAANVENKVEVLVTDGWYCVRARLDKMLTEFVYSNKLVIGTKIMTNGAELLNCEQGVSPWEDISSVRLNLFGNSTRRARWDSRLGYHSNVSIPSRLSLLRADGGKVSKLRVLVTRVYPTLYIEKFEDGNTVTRSERLENLHEMKYESERQALLEKLYEEVEKEFSEPEFQDSEDMLDSSKKRKLEESDTRVMKIMKTCTDSEDLGNHLTESQTKLLQDNASRCRERLLRDVQARLLEKMEKHDLCKKRNVVTLLKVRIADVEDKKNGFVVTKGMLSVWKPNDSVLELIREGDWINLLNVVPTSYRSSELHISAGRQSIFSKAKYKEHDKNKAYIEPLLRKCYHIQELIVKSALSIDYNEIDTVGIIVCIEPSIEDFDSNTNQFQNVFLADNNKNMICVNFWGGLKKFGFERVLDTGQIVACVNLQVRVGNTRKNIPQYRVTEFTYFTKAPKNVKTRETLEGLDKKLHLDRRKFCEDCVNLKNDVTRLQKNENVTPYRMNSVNLAKSKMFLATPAGDKRDIVNELDLSGLDFDSTFKRSDTQELSPKVLLRRKQAKEKINRLRMYGEPPPLSRIHIINKSAIDSYKSPLRSVENSVARIKSNDNGNFPKIVSPVTSLNRTYVKSALNPVKINFDNALKSGEKNFEEEFDGSPPLSLVTDYLN